MWREKSPRKNTHAGSFSNGAYIQRFRQGWDAVAILEVRDWLKYGYGGRTFDNIYLRNFDAALKEYHKTGVWKGAFDRIIEKATKANVEITDAAINGAKFLKKAGPLFAVAGLGFSAHEIISAPEGQRAYVTGQVASETAGGWAGGSLGVGLCIAFGITTSGWGLLACGLVGGVGGSYVGGGIYQSVNPRKSVYDIQDKGLIDYGDFVPYGHYP